MDRAYSSPLYLSDVESLKLMESAPNLLNSTNIVDYSSQILSLEFY